jgi:hypothetical protein
MRYTVLTTVGVALIAALAAQTATASERHHTRINGRTVAIQQFRNTNAYAAPNYAGMQQDGSSLSESAMTSGPAGH